MVRAGEQGAEKLPLKKQPGERHCVRHRQGRPVDLRPPPVLQLDILIREKNVIMSDCHSNNEIINRTVCIQLVRTFSAMIYPHHYVNGTYSRLD